MAECLHFSLLGELLQTQQEAQPQVCPACVASGDPWVYLRKRVKCGSVGCCESSQNKHALRHFRATQHPVIQLIEQPDLFYCYLDDIYARIPREGQKRQA